jgi:hypothetical protein
MSKITAKMLAKALGAKRTHDCEAALLADLNDPRIQRLVVMACVADVPLHDLGVLTYSFYSVDGRNESEVRQYVARTLCPTEAPDA